MLQAIRRVHRFGQEKLVHIYRFVGLKTIDVNILENRERSLVGPVWENSEVLPRLSKIDHVAPRTELSKLVMVGGKMALAPKGWVEKNKVDVEAADFAADVLLSNAYEELEEGNAVDE